jgi:hypothetical protein
VAAGGDVLHDHVDVDGAVGEGPEQVRGDTGPVGDLGDGDLGLGCVMGDRRDDRLLHVLVLLLHPRTRFPGEARPDMQLHVVVPSKLDRSERQHPSPARGDLQHLLV